MLGMKAQIDAQTREKLMLFSKGVCTNLGASRLPKVFFQGGQISQPLVSLDQAMLPIYDLNDRFLVDFTFEEVRKKFACTTVSDVESTEFELSLKGKDLQSPGQKSHYSHSVRNSSVKKDDKLLVMSGVSLSLKKDHEQCDSKQLQESRNKYSEMADEIITELHQSIFKNETCDIPLLKLLDEQKIQFDPHHTLPFYQRVSEFNLYDHKRGKREAGNKETVHMETEVLNQELFPGVNSENYESIRENYRNSIPSVVTQQYTNENTEGATRKSSKFQQLAKEEKSKRESINSEKKQVKEKQSKESDSEICYKSERDSSTVKSENKYFEFQTLPDEETPMRELSIEKSLQLSSMEQPESQTYQRHSSSDILPETAKFNPVPVELLEDKEIDIRIEKSIAGEKLQKKHHKNQISFGKKASSENTTKVIHFQEDKLNELQIPNELTEYEQSEEEEIIVKKCRAKQDSIVSLKDQERRRTEEKSRSTKSQFSPPYNQIQSPYQKRSPFINQPLTCNASSATTQKLSSKHIVKRPKEEAKSKKQREFLVRNVNEHRKMIYEINQQKNNDSQIRSEVMSSDENPCYSIEEIKHRKSVKSIKSHFVNNSAAASEQKIFFDRNFKGKLHKISRPKSNILSSHNYQSNQEPHEKKSKFQEFLISEKAMASRSKFRHSKSSQKLRNTGSRGSMHKNSMKKQQSMTDFQKKNESLYPPSLTPSMRPSSKQSHKDKRFNKSPYQAHWNQRVLQELFNVSYSGNRVVHHKSQKSLKQKEKSPGLSMKHHSIVNPFSGAVFPRQSFSINNLGQGLESVPSISDLSSRRHHADQSGISIQRELTPPIIHSTNYQQKQKDTIFTHQGGFKRPGSRTSLARNNSGHILQQKLEKIKKLQKKQKQKFLINALSRRPTREKIVNSPDQLNPRRAIPVKIPQSSASMANLKSGLKSHFGLNNPQQQVHNESVGAHQHAGGSGVGGVNQQRGGDNYIHNHINININHNYRGGNMGKKRED